MFRCSSMRGTNLLAASGEHASVSEAGLCPQGLSGLTMLRTLKPTASHWMKSPESCGLERMTCGQSMPQPNSGAVGHASSCGATKRAASPG